MEAAKPEVNDDSLEEPDFDKKKLIHSQNDLNKELIYHLADLLVQGHGIKQISATSDLLMISIVTCSDEHMRLVYDFDLKAWVDVGTRGTASAMRQLQSDDERIVDKILVFFADLEEYSITYENQADQPARPDHVADVVMSFQDSPEPLPEGAISYSGDTFINLDKVCTPEPIIEAVKEHEASMKQPSSMQTFKVMSGEIDVSSLPDWIKGGCDAFKIDPKFFLEKTPGDNFYEIEEVVKTLTSRHRLKGINRVELRRENAETCFLKISNEKEQEVWHYYPADSVVKLVSRASLPQLALLPVEENNTTAITAMMHLLAKFLHFQYLERGFASAIIGPGSFQVKHDTDNGRLGEQL